MLTRRTFFASLAALAVAPRVAPVAVDAWTPAVSFTTERWTFHGVPIYWDDETPSVAVFKQNSVWRDGRRRDDGDTILELR